MKESPWEDSLLERKSESDLKDLLKTLVAFANSVRPGHVAEILIGERDDGSIQGVQDPEQIQRTIRKNCEKIYPPILWRSEVYEKEGKLCIRIQIEYDGDTPHFGGPSWVRKGSSTMAATEEQFQALVALRSNKVRELAKWIGKRVTVGADMGKPLDLRHHGFSTEMHPRLPINEYEATLQEVNEFWLTLALKTSRLSEPLDKVLLNWDPENERLAILIRV
jgi:hypothetical protein